MLRTVTLLIVLAALAAAPAAAATPTVSVQQAIDLWITSFVRGGWENGQPVFHDCYANLEQIVPPRLVPLAREMERLGGFLMNESIAEMVGDPTAFVARLRLKRDWSPALRAMVRGAIVRAGFLVPDETAGTATPDPDQPTCDTGRCDCRECSPHILCDCKTITKFDGPRPIECADKTRFNCNAVAWKPPEWPEEVPWTASRPPVVDLITR